MNLKSTLLSGVLGTLALAGTWSAPVITYAQAPDEAAEVLTRGPVHEAFAATISNEAEAGIVVNKRPPEMIEEEPPDQRPDGDNVTWIPGYWAWDDDSSDFLWVSGIWRALPPGREWIPGYWAEAEGGFQWTSGYWEDEEATEVAYLPSPPKSLETGPTVQARSDDEVWIPGYWNWRETRYVWRPGYWTGGRENWIWTPPYYRYTPRGYVYVSGFWDYAVPVRGVVFAPVRYREPIYLRPGYHYSPLIVIATTVFLDHLFVRPRYNHYYFGDYYEPNYRDRGYFASVSFMSSRRGYDPIFEHYRWLHRRDPRWEDSRREYFEFRRDHAEARPARDWAMLSAKPDRNFAERLDRYVADRPADRQAVSFRKVSDDDRRRFETQEKEVVQFKERRKERESGKSAPKPEKDQIVVEKTEPSPVKAKVSATAEGGATAPPKRLDQGERPEHRGKGSDTDLTKQGDNNRGEGADKGKRPDRPDMGDTKKGDNEPGKKPDRGQGDVKKPDTDDIKKPDNGDTRKEGGDNGKKPDRGQGDMKKPDTGDNMKKPERGDIKKPDTTEPPKKPERSQDDTGKKNNPEPKIKTPTPEPKVKPTPVPEPRVKTPQPEPRVKAPTPEPRVRTPEPEKPKKSDNSDNSPRVINPPPAQPQRSKENVQRTPTPRVEPTRPTESSNGKKNASGSSSSSSSDSDKKKKKDEE